MSFSYTVRESVSGFRRTRLSSTLSIVTICIALLLMGLFAVITIHAERFLEDLRNRVELEAFLVEPAATVTIDSVGQVITAFEGVDSVVHVSKANAAEIFKREFGEDILTVLDFNPLPPSMKIFLKDGYKTSRQVQLIEARLRTMPEIESVIYHKAMLEVIDERAGNIHHVTLALGVFISLSAIVLVSNTIRLAIYAKRKLIRTMELVGATRMFIRLPFLLEGILQGIIGGGLAVGLLYGILGYLLRLVSPELAAFVHMEPAFYVAVLAAGALLGLTGSMISVLRFIGSGNGH
jgi:cell division transport system permease protein